MKRRSRSGGERTKEQPRKALNPERNASKAVKRSDPAVADLEAEVHRLTRELNEALQQQAATSEVLGIISSSRADLEPVFSAMLEKAVRICEARFGTLYLSDGDDLRLVAAHGVPAKFAQAQARAPFRPASDGLLGAVMRTGATVHLPDLGAVPSYAEGHPRKPWTSAAFAPWSACPCARTTHSSASLPSFVRRFVHSPTSRSSYKGPAWRRRTGDVSGTMCRQSCPPSPQLSSKAQ